MTSKPIPAAASASASSPPRPKTNGSPPFKRTTRFPSRASRIRSCVISSCESACAPAWPRSRDVVFGDALLVLPQLELEELADDLRVRQRFGLIVDGFVTNLRDDRVEQPGDDRERHVRDQHTLALGEIRTAREEPLDLRFSDRLGFLRQGADHRDRGTRLIPLAEATHMGRDDLFDEGDRLPPALEADLDDVFERIDIDQVDIGDRGGVWIDVTTMSAACNAPTSPGSSAARPIPRSSTTLRARWNVLLSTTISATPSALSRFAANVPIFPAPRMTTDLSRSVPSRAFARSIAAETTLTDSSPIQVCERAVFPAASASRKRLCRIFPSEPAFCA